MDNAMHTNPTRTENLSSRFEADSKCRKCAGTGKRGRGRCGACEGRGGAGLDHPRIRFNWGFHDATFEREHNMTREVVATGQQTTKTVSAEFSFWYALGYGAGLRAEGRPESSSPAWTETTGGLSEDF